MPGTGVGGGGDGVVSSHSHCDILQSEQTHSHGLELHSEQQIHGYWLQFPQIFKGQFSIVCPLSPHSGFSQICIHVVGVHSEE